MATFSFLKIDRHDPEIALLANNYRLLRLKALELSPAAFASTLQVEALLPEGTWISRITDPSKETFVCVATTEDGASEWVGQVTLRGPLTVNQFRLSLESGQAEPLPDEQQEKWQMLSLYTLPDYRGQGLGKKLCQSAYNYLATRPGISPEILVRIMVKPENTITLGLYKSMGFVNTAMCTLEEALRANGDADLLPPGPLTDRFTTVGGIVLALEMKRRETKP